MKKNIKYLLVLLIIFPFLITSCLKEDDISAPSVNAVKMYMVGKDGKDSLVTEAVKGKAVKFVVETDADICSVWPGGLRVIMKKKDNVTDSLDMFNHPVLKPNSNGVGSDCYIDYGLVGARGYKTSQTPLGWSCTYTYANAGEFDLTVVATNHGYEDADFKQTVHNGGKVVVR